MQGRVSEPGIPKHPQGTETYEAENHIEGDAAARELQTI
jgi:hypothetical protein